MRRGTYESDVTEKEWKIIEPYFCVGKYGNRRKHEVREWTSCGIKT